MSNSEPGSFSVVMAFTPLLTYSSSLLHVCSSVSADFQGPTHVLLLKVPPACLLWTPKALVLVCGVCPVYTEPVARF